jgi:hypothetical protein
MRRGDSPNYPVEPGARPGHVVIQEGHMRDAVTGEEITPPGPGAWRWTGDRWEQVVTSEAKLKAAALRLLDSVRPFISALEVEPGADGEELYGDLAEALGLPRDYGSDDWREREAETRPSDRGSDDPIGHG